MDAAAARIADAVMRGETVAIFGDYDVDGATSAATAGALPAPCRASIRSSISPTACSRATARMSTRSARSPARGATLLVTVDCGTVSHEPLAEAARLGMETIVIDHHLADETLPPALAVVNPNRLDDLSKLGHLAAVGLVFMTVVAVNRELRRRGFWSDGAAGAGPARSARSRRARHRRRRGAAQGAQPRLRRQGAAGDAAARACRPDRA